MTPENQTEILVNCMKNGQMVYMTPMSEPEKNAIVAAVNAPKGTPEDPKIAEIKMNIYETIKGTAYILRGILNADALLLVIAKDPEAAAQVKEIAAVAPNSVTKLDRRFALNSIKSINKFIFKLLGFAARVGFQVGWDIFKDSQGPYKGPRFPTGNKGRGPEYCPPKIKSQEECWKWFEAVEWTNIEQKKYRDTCENICNEEWPQDRGKKCAMRCKWGYFDKYKLDYWTNYESSISSAITTL